MSAGKLACGCFWDGNGHSQHLPGIFAVLQRRIRSFYYKLGSDTVLHRRCFQRIIVFDFLRSLVTRFVFWFNSKTFDPLSKMRFAVAFRDPFSVGAFLWFEMLLATAGQISGHIRRPETTKFVPLVFCIHFRGLGGDPCKRIRFFARLDTRINLYSFLWESFGTRTFKPNLLRERRDGTTSVPLRIILINKPGVVDSRLRPSSTPLPERRCAFAVLPLRTQSSAAALWRSTAFPEPT